ncbi:MAG: nonstructural protein [Microvirus sp.]|nr:MAG: nonstructural protein [Microvirus sp.]
MNFQLFSIFDMKAGVFLSPFVSRSETDAERQISSSLRDPGIKDTPVGQNPEDFALYKIGKFDDELGRIESDLAPRLVKTLKELGSTVSS